MLGKHDHSKRNRIQFVTINEMVPQNHLLRKIDKVIDFILRFSATTLYH